MGHGPLIGLQDDLRYDRILVYVGTKYTAGMKPVEELYQDEFQKLTKQTLVELLRKRYPRTPISVMALRHASGQHRVWWPVPMLRAAIESAGGEDQLADTVAALEEENRRLRAAVGDDPDVDETPWGDTTEFLKNMARDFWTAFGPVIQQKIMLTVGPRILQLLDNLGAQMPQEFADYNAGDAAATQAAYQTDVPLKIQDFMARVDWEKVPEPMQDYLIAYLQRTQILPLKG